MKALLQSLYVRDIIGIDQISNFLHQSICEGFFGSTNREFLKKRVRMISHVNCSDIGIYHRYVTFCAVNSDYVSFHFLSAANWETFQQVLDQSAICV